MWSLFLNYQNKQGFLKIENTVAKEALNIQSIV